MNFLTLGLRTLKIAEKAKKTARETNERFGQDVVDPEEAFDHAIHIESTRLEKALEIGLTYYEKYNERMASYKAIGQSAKERWYMLTIRPPHDTTIDKLIDDTDKFIKKWSPNWVEYEYVYEQKGTCDETMGHGAHVHIIIRTEKKNYYPSHIIRDAQRNWTYVAANCIQLDTIRNLTRAKEYIRGIKNNDEKAPAVEYDKKWRSIVGLADIYSSGQVQAALDNC